MPDPARNASRERCSTGRHDPPIADHPTSCPCGLVTRVPKETAHARG